MGHAIRECPRCDVIDELEAAVTLRQAVRVFLRDSTVQAGLPVDVVTHDHEDYLHLENHHPISVSDIRWVERMRRAPVSMPTHRIIAD